ELRIGLGQSVDVQKKAGATHAH
ncbi:MAG: hypothetical protein RJA70_3236, partial [Pseudomonadota bacterium]